MCFVIKNEMKIKKLRGDLINLEIGDIIFLNGANTKFSFVKILKVADNEFLINSFDLIYCFIGTSFVELRNFSGCFFERKSQNLYQGNMHIGCCYLDYCYKFNDVEMENVKKRLINGGVFLNEIPFDFLYL